MEMKFDYLIRTPTTTANPVKESIQLLYKCIYYYNYLSTSI